MLLPLRVPPTVHRHSAPKSTRQGRMSADIPRETQYRRAERERASYARGLAELALTEETSTLRERDGSYPRRGTREERKKGRNAEKAKINLPKSVCKQGALSGTSSCKLKVGVCFGRRRGNTPARVFWEV